MEMPGDRPGYTYKPDDAELIASVLRPMATGEPLPFHATFIHHADVYSASPDNLVAGRCAAPGTDVWYFACTARFKSKKRAYGRRQRAVSAGGAGEGTWHSEGGIKKVHGAGGHYQKFSYGAKIAGVFKRGGWCMTEYQLDDDDDGHDEDGVDRLVLCKLYHSPRHVHRAAATTAMSVSGKKRKLPADVDCDQPEVYRSPRAVRSATGTAAAMAAPAPMPIFAPAIAPVSVPAPIFVPAPMPVPAPIFAPAPAPVSVPAPTFSPAPAPAMSGWKRKAEDEHPEALSWSMLRRTAEEIEERMESLARKLGGDMPPPLCAPNSANPEEDLDPMVQNMMSYLMSDDDAMDTTLSGTESLLDGACPPCAPHADQDIICLSDDEQAQLEDEEGLACPPFDADYVEELFLATREDGTSCAQAADLEEFLRDDHIICSSATWMHKIPMVS